MAKPITIVLALTLLAACGSRSGGPPEDYITDDPADDRIAVDDLDVVRDFVPISPAPQYTGLQNRAIITQGNSLDLLNAFYILLETAADSVLTLYNVPYPDLLLYQAPPSPDEEPLCLSGDYRHSLHEEEQRVVIIGSYHNCELASGGRIHGQQTIDLRFNTAGTEIVRSEFRLRNITLRDGDIEILIHGELQGGYGLMRFTDFVYENVTLGYSVYTDDMVINVLDQEYTGTFFHSDWGSVELFEGAAPGGVRLLGARTTELTAVRRSRAGSSFLELVQTGTQGVRNRAELAILELFAWPYTTDRTPVAVLKAPDVFKRSETVSFSADYAGTAPRGFLTYDWEYLSGPSGCNVDLMVVSVNERTFTADCRGTHELRLVADNGVQQYYQTFSVQTIGELPDVAGISHRPADLDEPESWQVVVDNTELDGPFTYNLINAPEGLEIDDTGRIRGTTSRLIPGGLGTLHLDVEVSNERSVVQSVAIDISSDAASVHVYDESPLSAAIKQPWVDYNGDGHLQNVIDYGQTYAVIEAKEGRVDYTYIEARGFSTGELLTRRIMDYDGDGQSDLVLVYPDRYIVIALDDFRVKHDTTFPDELVKTRANQAKVIGGVEPAILLGYHQREGMPTRSALRYDIPSRTYEVSRYVWHTPSSDSRIYHVADFSGDGYESVYQRADGQQHQMQGRLVNLPGRAVEFPYGVYALDLTGNGITDLVRPQLPQEADAERTLEIFDHRIGSVRDTLPILGAPAFSTDNTEILTFDRGDGSERGLVIVERGTSQWLHILEKQGDSYQWLRREQIASRGQSNPRTVVPFGEGKLAVHAGSSIDGGLFTLDSEGNRGVLTQAFGRHEQLIPFHADPDSGELEVIGFNAVTNETRSASANRITLGKNAERVALENHPSFRGRASWDGRPALLAHEGGTRPRLVYESLTRHKIVDFETGEIVIDRLRDDINHFYAVDLSGDGREELFGLTYDRFVQIDIADLSRSVLGERPVNQLPYRPRDITLVDAGGSVPPRLLVPRRPSSPNHEQVLEVYQHQGGQGITSIELPLNNSVNNAQLAQQDITGDGVPEVIVWGSRYPGEIIVMNANFGVIDRFTIGHEIEKVLNMPDHRSNRLIFTHSRGVPAGHIRIAEYDSQRGKIVSESQVFPGQLQRDGLICLGDDLYTCDKFLVFDRAVYHVQGPE
ncbi:hypothetical protein [Marinimicrobium alkaliphilum]|uniref:hypothetical protein n=1 Tax=Marinimicrobium alkaliphilum TaxID=2202654 RepID=UPI000DBAB757|nr:hypothetical protein [Marinimicrobium alkaliphilum]